MTVTLTLDHWLAADRRVFRMKRKDIDGALKGDTGIIDGVTEKNKENIFYMLMFCLCVPQSKAVKAEEAIEILRKQDFYRNHMSLEEVIAIVKGRVRFQATKSKRLMEAKSSFFESFWPILLTQYAAFRYSSESTHYTHNEVISDEDVDANKEADLQRTRSCLIGLVNGMGMKLASHFMRNVGMPGLAILDVHVINGLYKRGIIDTKKLGPSQAEYLDIEQKMKEYAEYVGISLDQLDLLLWSQKTGYVFK